MEDPRGFLARFEKDAVFDEAQRWPDLFSYLQGMVDAQRVPGRFVLTLNSSGCSRASLNLWRGASGSLDCCRWRSTSCPPLRGS